MEELIKTVGSWIVWVASVGGAVAVVYKWVATPIRDIQRKVTDLQKKMEITQEDTADILCDRLYQAYDYHMKKGWCPKADKARLVDMYKRYNALGRNHLASHYAKDLISLPESPPKGV